MRKHGLLCLAASRQLHDLVVAANDGDWPTVEEHYNRVTELEHKADLQKRKIRRRLPRGFFLPVARADLLNLVSRQDEVANTSRDFAGLVVGRRLQFPEPTRQALLELTDATIATCEGAADLFGAFDELLESGFSGREATKVREMTEQVEDCEALTDKLVVTLRAELYRLEEGLPPVQAVFFYRALDLIAQVADDSERTAHIVQLLVAR